MHESDREPSFIHCSLWLRHPSSAVFVSVDLRQLLHGHHVFDRSQRRRMHLGVRLAHVQLILLRDTERKHRDAGTEQVQEWKNCQPLGLAAGVVAVPSSPCVLFIPLLRCV